MEEQLAVANPYITVAQYIQASTMMGLDADEFLIRQIGGPTPSQIDQLPKREVQAWHKKLGQILNHRPVISIEGDPAVMKVSLFTGEEVNIPEPTTQQTRQASKYHPNNLRRMVHLICLSSNLMEDEVLAWQVGDFNGVLEFDENFF